MSVNCLKTAHEPFINYNNYQLGNKSVAELSQKVSLSCLKSLAELSKKNLLNCSVMELSCSSDFPCTVDIQLTSRFL